MSNKNQSFITEQDKEDASQAMKFLISPDLRNKEVGLHRFVELFKRPPLRDLFESQEGWLDALKTELLHSENEIISMLSLWALSNLALEKNRCPALATEDVLECARDILGTSFNSDLIEKTLWFLLNISHNEECLKMLTMDTRLCAYLTDLAGSENPAVQLSAVKVLLAFASGQHALVFVSVFCRKRGFRTLCAIMDARERCSYELLETVLNLTSAFIDAGEPDVSLKKLFIVGGLLSSLEGAASNPDAAIKNKVLSILTNLVSSCPDMITTFENNGIVELAKRLLLGKAESPSTQSSAALLMKALMKHEHIAKSFAFTGFCQSVVTMLDTDKDKVMSVLELISTMAMNPMLKCELIASKILSRLSREEVELSALVQEDNYQNVLKAINECRSRICERMEPETVQGVLEFLRQRSSTLSKSQRRQANYVQRVWTSAMRAKTAGEDLEDDKQEESQPEKDRNTEQKGDGGMLEKRDNIAQEILATEQRYVKSLQQCIDTYLNALNVNGILSPENVKALFANIEEVCLHNKRFLRMLEDKMEGWNDQSCLGEVFSTFWVGYTKDVYSMYINNFDSALDLYYKLMDEIPQFNAFVMASKKQIGLDLSSYLVMPVQRMPRYLLLLATLLEATPEGHPDKAGLQLAVTNARQLTDLINNDKRVTEERRKWLETVKQLDAIPASFDVNKPTRRLIKKGLLIESSTSRSSHYIFLLLCNDSIIITSQQKKKLKVTKTIELKDVSVDESVQLFSGSSVHNFTMKYSDHSYTFCANSAEERDEWIQAFKSAIQQGSADATQSVPLPPPSAASAAAPAAAAQTTP